MPRPIVAGILRRLNPEPVECPARFDAAHSDLLDGVSAPTLAAVA